MYLNSLPGPKLTTTDVQQRLRAYWEEPHTTYPKDELKDGCLAIFAAEKADGTEMPAIDGRSAEHVKAEGERLRKEHEAWYKDLRERERLAAEQRLMSGTDCRWTRIEKSKECYCRMNGRTYRLTPTKDKRLHLHQVDTPSLDEKGTLIGTYKGRADATKVVAKIAYEAEYR